MLERGLFLAEPQPFCLRNFGCAASGHNLSYAHAYPDAPAVKPIKPLLSTQFFARFYRRFFLLAATANTDDKTQLFNEFLIPLYPYFQSAPICLALH